MEWGNFPGDLTEEILYRVFLVRINLHGLQHNDVSPSVKVAYHFNLNASPVAIYNVVHCEGLLLCTIKDNKTRGLESMVRGNQVGLT
ncbi:unnamed protein product [Brassica rapa subsp. narinosa]